MFDPKCSRIAQFNTNFQNLGRYEAIVPHLWYKLPLIYTIYNLSGHCFDFNQSCPHISKSWLRACLQLFHKSHQNYGYTASLTGLTISSESSLAPVCIEYSGSLKSSYHKLKHQHFVYTLICMPSFLATIIYLILITRAWWQSNIIRFERCVLR